VLKSQSRIHLIMPNPIATLTTARILGEAINSLHFHDLHRLHTDPQVMKTPSAVRKPLSEEKNAEISLAVTNGCARIRRLIWST
jgi:hypothetical protein